MTNETSEMKMENHAPNASSTGKAKRRLENATGQEAWIFSTNSAFLWNIHA